VCEEMSVNPWTHDEILKIIKYQESVGKRSQKMTKYQDIAEIVIMAENREYVKK
jgi:hypothetical protein